MPYVVVYVVPDVVPDVERGRSRRNFRGCGRRQRITCRRGQRNAGQPLLFQRRDHRFDMVSIVPSSLVSEMLNFSL
jgi:hypothetical protein